MKKAGAIISLIAAIPTLLISCFALFIGEFMSEMHWGDSRELTIVIIGGVLSVICAIIQLVCAVLAFYTTSKMPGALLVIVSIITFIAGAIAAFSEGVSYFAMLWNILVFIGGYLVLLGVKQEIALKIQPQLGVKQEIALKIQPQFVIESRPINQEHTSEFYMEPSDDSAKFLVRIVIGALALLLFISWLIARAGK